MAGRLYPLRDRRQEGQGSDGPGSRLDQPGRDGQREHAELTRDRAGGDDPVGGDVVGTGRTSGDDALQQRLPHVRFVHELHRQFRRQDRERNPAGPPGQCADRRPERPARQALRADDVRAQHDGRAQQVQGGCTGPRGPRPQQVFQPGLLLGVEQPSGGAYRPGLGHSGRVVPVKAVSGHRGREDEAADAGRGCGVEGVKRSVDVDRLDRLAGGVAGHLERQVDHDVSVAERVAQHLGVADVAAPVLRLRPAVRGGVERAPRDARHTRHPVICLKQGHEAEPQGAGRAGHRDRQVRPRLQCHLPSPSEPGVAATIRRQAPRQGRA